jgi:hypothetical protein
MTHTICVSGYPPLPATTFSVGSVTCWVAGSVSNIAHAVTAVVKDLRDFDRCRGCNGWRWGKNLNRGFGPPYCSTCATTLTTTCKQRFQRIPNAAEFYCGNPAGTQGCGQIVPRIYGKGGRTNKDPDGRERYRCYDCRRKQWKTARVNRRRRGILRELRREQSD